VAALIVSHSPAVNSYDGQGSLLHTVAASGTAAAVRALLARGAAGSSAGSRSTGSMLCSRLAELSSPVAVNARDSRGRTPLHVAASAVSVDVVLALLAAGAVVNAGDATGATPLHYLARTARGAEGPVNSFVALWRVLIAAGADAHTAMDDDGLTAAAAAPEWLVGCEL
jgi:ankyrin repeat protein